MVSSPKRVAALLAGLSALTVGATAQQFSAMARPAARVTQKVDTAVTTRLAGTRPGFVGSAAVGARIAPSKQLQHLNLVLTSSPEQEAALAQLMGEQQDKSSTNYHKWLTPESFGEHFGASQADIAKITAWLGDQGLSVEGVSKSRRLITFSGSAAQVEAAFKTQIANVIVDGAAHTSNITEVSVPSALSTVVAGVARLNDVRPTRAFGKTSTVQLDGVSTAGSPTPMYGTSTGTHYVTPGDAAIIYNTTPLTSAGIDGTGQTVAILAQSNIDVADVQKFRSMFGLPKKDPIITMVDQDPGLNPDDGEAYLDAEWGGALAPNAQVNFIVSSPNFYSGGVDAAALYTVENNIGDIISLSYGGCEYNNGATYTAFWNGLWEQAAAQGQTVFVSSGDSGVTGCVSSSATSAGTTAVYSVNSLGSSAYNVAVGGSIFVDFGQTAFWGTTGTVVPFVNALSYIPEAPLNQGRLAPTYLNAAATAYQTGSGIFAAGGGISIYTARPAWQTGSGIPTNTDTIAIYSGSVSTTGIAPGSSSDGTHRLVPDLVNISANGHDGTLYCASSLCSTTSTGGLNNAGVVGGTSVATPVQAGIQALINQKNGGRQGNILPTLYKLASTQYNTSTTACQAGLGSATTPAVLPAATCNFHDVVTGSLTVPASTSGTVGYGFLAQAGFDEASGLGSMNVNNVATNWTTAGLATSQVTFTLSPTITTHGTAQTLTATVAQATGTTVPTGDISLVAETANPGGPRLYTLTAGSFSGAVARTAASDGYGDTLTSTLPAGSYNVHVHYGGDVNFAASDSVSVPVIISKEASTTTTTPFSFDASTLTNTQSTTFTYGGPAVYLSTLVAPSTGKGVATGSVTYGLTRNGSSIAGLTTNLDGQGLTYFYSGFAYPSYYLKPNYAPLVPGTYVATTSYAGDNSLNSSTSTTSFTVGQATPVITFSGPANITSGATSVFGFKIAQAGASTTAPTTTVLATGTVTFVDTTTASSLGSCTLTAGTCSFLTTGITVTGGNTITATYGGDANYAPATSTFTTTVGTLTASTLTLTGSGTATVGYVYTLKATMAPTAATGTASFFDSNIFLGSCTLASGSCSLALGVSPTATNGTGGTLTAGVHNFSATYSGSTTYSSSTGTLSTTIAQSTTTITLSGPANSTYGQPVLLSVYINRSSNSYGAPAIPLTGTFSILEGATVLATGTPVYDGGGYHYYVAAATVSTLSGGTHTLTATYSGDANFAASTATLTVIVVVAPLTPAITLSSTSTAYAQGSGATLTATVPLSSTLAAPTGGVTFTNTTTTATYAGTLTYNAAAGSYVSSLSLAGLTGSNTFTVTLNSDTNYNAVTSAPLVINVVTNNVWVVNGNGSVSELSSTGAAVMTGTAGTGGTKAVRIDNSGNVWSLTANGVVEYSKTGTLLGTYTAGGFSTPTSLAIDGSGYVWVTNNNGSVSVLNNNGTAFSPTAYASPTLSTPTSINVDASGSLWITNSGDSSLVEVIGAANPVTTPQTTAVKNATPAARP